jgi:hypothetical protein
VCAHLLIKIVSSQITEVADAELGLVYFKPELHANRGKVKATLEAWLAALTERAHLLRSENRT